jgi:putative DNA primase/helicase
MDKQAAFREAMSNAGIDPPAEILSDGSLHRFHVSGDKPRSENGWYVFHDGDTTAGAFGCWKRGISETWSDREYRSLTTEEKEHYTKRMELIGRQRNAEQAERRAECIAKAESMLKAAHDVKADHAYLLKKNIKPYGARQLKDMLLIPSRKQKTLTGLQIIMPDGSKKFLTGTEKAGAYLPINGKGKTVYLVEGWATGCTIHELTCASVIVCFDCGNLEPVAIAIKKKRQVVVLKCPTKNKCNLFILKSA